MFECAVDFAMLGLSIEYSTELSIPTYQCALKKKGKRGNFDVRDIMTLHAVFGFEVTNLLRSPIFFFFSPE
jgi:hypothetical protein